MFPPHHLGGYELMWEAATRAHLAAGHEVTVLSTDFRLQDPEPWQEPCEVSRSLSWYWREHRFPALPFRSRLALERHNLAILDRALARHRPHVVSWWAMGGMSLSLIEAVRRRGLPAVGFVHDDWMQYGPRVDGWQAGLRRLRVPLGVAELCFGIPARLALDRAARWVFVSETTRARAEAAGWRVAGSPIAHSGIDPALFRQHPPRSWTNRLLWVGRLDPRKGPELAIRALAELPGTRLRLVGPGPDSYRQELVRLAGSLGVEERLELTVAGRSELPAEYAEADAVLFPVLWEEPWGLVPLEAMAVGRPVVASGAGGSAEYLRDGENCLIYAPREDPAALAGAVRRLAAEPELRVQLVAAGLETADAHTVEAFTARVEEELVGTVSQGGEGNR